MILARGRFVLTGLLTVLAFSFTGLRAGEPDGQNAAELARAAFGADHWTVTAPIRYYDSARGSWIFAASRKSEKEGKRVTFRPFAMISRSRDGEPITFLADEAVLVFDQFSDSAARPDELRAAIEAANRRFVDDFARGDSAAVASAYTDDAQLLPPNQEAISGRKAIDGFYRAAIASGAKALTLETSDVGGGGDLAYETGRFKILGDKGKLVEAGKYLVVWKRVAGAWRLHRDVWNSSTPMSSLIDSPQPIRPSPR